MSIRLKKCLLFPLIGFLAGCGNLNPMYANRVAKTANLAPNEALLIVGHMRAVYPAWDRVIVEGDRVGRLPAFNGKNAVLDETAPRFTVWRLKNVSPETALGIVSIGTGSKGYKPCGDARMPVVKLSPQEVIYVGDIDYSLIDNKLVMSWKFSSEEAKEYLKSEMPSAVGKFEERPLTLIKTSPCPV